MSLRALIGLPLSSRWYHFLGFLLCLLPKAKLFSPLFFFFFFFWQEVSGDDDTVDAGERMTEVDEGVAERQEMVLETTGDVISKDTPVHKGDSGDIIADKTLGTVVSDEAILAMADEAVHETAPIMADEVPVGWTDEAYVDMTDVAPVDMAHEIVAVMADKASVGVAHIGTKIASVTADEASVGMADVICVDTSCEITPIVVNSNLAIIVGSAVEDSPDQDIDSIDSEETILAEPQPLQIIPFASQHDEPRIIDLVRSHANLPFARMASIMEGISLFGVAPRFERVLREEDPPVVVGDQSLSGALIGSQVHALEGASIQDVDGGGMVDTEVHGVDTVPTSDIFLVDESKPLLLFITFICYILLGRSYSSLLLF